MSSYSGLYLYLNAAELGASLHQEMTDVPFLTLCMQIYCFLDLKDFPEDSNIQQTHFQEERLLSPNNTVVDVCLQAEPLSLSTVYSRDLYFASFQATRWEEGIHLQTISILFEQFLAGLLCLI